MSDNDEADVIFIDVEPDTERRDLLTTLLSRSSELEAIAGQVTRTLQREGIGPRSKSQVALSLTRMHGILRELETALGIYSGVPRRPDP